MLLTLHIFTKAPKLANFGGSVVRKRQEVGRAPEAAPASRPGHRLGHDGVEGAAATRQNGLEPP